MKILVIGASGLIGSAVCARLAADGHEVVGSARGKAPCGRPVARWLRIDMARATAPSDWLPHLHGVAAVVNCAGVLQDGPRDDSRRVHVDGPAALFGACEQAGVRRVIHVSAIGVDRRQVSGFSATKHAGEAALKARDLDWVILRPSVVLGRDVFGASALFRGLAALPVLPELPDTGPLQVVTLDDVAETVARLVDGSGPACVEFDLAGTERLTMSQLVALYRAWLGWPAQRIFRIPGWIAGILYRLGDFAGLLGWRPPVRTTARLEIEQGAVGDPSTWTELTGIHPRPLRDLLSKNPAGVQERWFARLYFVKPALVVALATFWMATGIISLTVGFAAGVDLMAKAKAGFLAEAGVFAGAVADILVGLAIAWRPTVRAGLWTAVALSAAYIVAGTLLLPELWKDPLGPLLKIVPILAAQFAALAILDER